MSWSSRSRATETTYPAGRLIFARAFPVALLLGMLAGCGGGDGGGGGEEEDPVADVPYTTTDYGASLSPEQVIDGAPAESSSGTAVFQTRFRGSFDAYASGTVTLTGFDADSVEVHAGFAGEAGPVVLALQQQGTTTWAIPANTEIEIEELRLLDTAGFYVRASGPQGVIRGQILPSGWGMVLFDLDGDEIVPAVPTSARGRGAITLYGQPPDGRYTYHLRVTLDGLAGATGGSMAEEFAGANGNERLALTRSNADISVWGSSEINNPDFEPFLTSASLITLAAGRYHVILRSAAYPDGEIRGQIVPEGVQVFPVELTADQVATGGPLPAPGSATAWVTYRESMGDIAIHLNTDVSDATMVSLHEAPAGQDGPLQLSLLQTFSPPGLWSLPATVLSADQQTAFDAGNLYVQMTTAAYPGGVLRGQLVESATTLATKAVIGPDGGTLSTADGVTLTVPAGALAEPRQISVRRLNGTAQLPALFADPLVPLNGAVRLEPHGLQFSVPVTLSVVLDKPAPPGASQPVLVHDPQSGAWQETPFMANANADGTAATVELGHFSDYVIVFAELASQGFFGPPDLLETPDQLFTRVKNRFTELFLLHPPVPLHPGILPDNDPEHPGLDLYNCYAPRAAYFILSSPDSLIAREELFPPNADTAGAAFSMFFNRPYDQTFSIGDASLEVVAKYSVTVYFYPESPDVQVTAMPGKLWVTGESEVSARVLCGEEGFAEQNVTLELDEANLGLLTPGTGVTDEHGDFVATFAASASQGGSGILTATTEWSNPLEGVSHTLDATTDLQVFSLTGTWSGTGIETVIGCEDEEDNGTFQDGGQFPISQNGFSITGSAYWTSFNGTVTPQPDGTFSVSGTYTDTEEGISEGKFSGTGSASSGTLSLTWSGRDSTDTCTFAGSGNATRVQGEP